ncbi:hypothetical protein ACUUL3_02720 [Thiovibrio sp. JS02]
MSLEQSKKKNRILNILFVLSCVGILIFLLKAPPESTKKIPRDDNHLKFYEMGKKEAEKYCESCHVPKGTAPLPADHPPKYRCLFCHKKQL